MRVLIEAHSSGDRVKASRKEEGALLVSAPILRSRKGSSRATNSPLRSMCRLLSGTGRTDQPLGGQLLNVWYPPPRHDCGAGNP